MQGCKGEALSQARQRDAGGRGRLVRQDPPHAPRFEAARSLRVEGRARRYFSSTKIGARTGGLDALVQVELARAAGGPARRPAFGNFGLAAPLLVDVAVGGIRERFFARSGPVGPVHAPHRLGVETARWC